MDKKHVKNKIRLSLKTVPLRFTVYTLSNPKCEELCDGRTTRNFLMDQKLAYIHNNPVEAGIVDEPESYLYSSARDYAGRKGLLDIEFIE